jgi:hypothetical protein
MKNLFAAILLWVAFMFLNVNANAQCAMCKASAETSMESGSTGAAGINKGVLYLFLTPYIVGGTIAFFWWRAKKKAEA